ncbi:MAG: PKD domain-containing protein [Flavisolibacter sp.]
MRTTIGCFPANIPLLDVWQRWHRFISCLTTLCILVATLLFTTQTYAQGPCASSNCTSGDIQITKVELLKPDGSALPNICAAGQTNVPVMLRVTFDVTSSTRYGFLVTGEVWINNSKAGTIANCDGSSFSQGVHTMDVSQYLDGSSILWPCGSTIQLKSVYTAWDQQVATATHAGICTYLNPDGSITDCSTIAPKCRFYGDGQSITVYAPLIADFTWLGSCVAGHTAQTVAFTNTTSGGKAGYTYVWDFGDGSATSTATNPAHDYTTAGNYTVRLIATDASTPTALVDTQSYSVPVTSCCTPPSINSQPTGQSKCQGTTASFTVGYTGGTPAPSIQWQVNTGTGFVNISNGGGYSGATTTTLTITGVTPSMNNYQYQAVLQSGTCTAVQSNAATLNVSAATVAGTLASSNTICSGSTSGSLTLSGYTGDIVRWESSANGSSNWTNISNITASYTSGALTSDIYYRVLVKSGVCDAAYSNIIHITVNSAPVITTSPSSRALCQASNASFSVAYTDGSPAATIQWQVNTGGGFTNITNGGVYSGATTTTLSITGVTPSMDGYQYRAVLQSGVCSAVNSAAATLNVSAATNAGTLSSSRTVCSGSTSGSLSLSGYVGTIVRWESSTTGSDPWSPISNTVSTYTSGTLSGDIWFRAVVKSGVCDARTSNAVKITVQQPITGNTIAASQTICSGTAPAGLTGSTPTGGSGTYSYQWQSATTGSFSNITGANNINYAPGNLSQTTQYRRIVSAGVCNASTSDAVTITISPESVVYSLMASNYCSTNTDKGTVVLSGSYPGVSYQLKKQSDGSNVQALQIGTGTSLTWTGVEGGTYYVLGTGVAPTYCTSTTASATVHEFDCSTFYTLTQGYYGGKNGKTCIGTTPVNTIKYLLGTTDLVVGTTNSVTVPGTDAGANKLNSVLPGGSTPVALPVGNCTITDNTCFKYPAYLTKQGKINNVLLSQTITLMLNTRWDGGRLLLFQLQSGWLTTQKLTGCGDSTVVVTQCSDGVVSSIKMNQNVLNYLGANNMVQDLLNLANGVLGGTLIPGQNGVPSYSDVNDAIDAINQSFDEGRRFLAYYPNKQTCDSLFPAASTIVTTFGTSRETTQSQTIAASKGVSVTAYPNPYTDKVSFTIESDVAGYGSLQVYNLMGQKVKTVYEGFMSAGKQNFTMTLPVQQRANLVYIFTVGNKQVTGKLLQLRK